MDQIESEQRDDDHFIFDCGEDDLTQHQEHFYRTRTNEIEKFIEAIKSNHSTSEGNRESLSTTTATLPTAFVKSRLVQGTHSISMVINPRSKRDLEAIKSNPSTSEGNCESLLHTTATLPTAFVKSGTIQGNRSRSIVINPRSKRDLEAVKSNQSTYEGNRESLSHTTATLSTAFVKSGPVQGKHSSAIVINPSSVRSVIRVNDSKLFTVAPSAGPHSQSLESPHSSAVKVDGRAQQSLPQPISPAQFRSPVRSNLLNTNAVNSSTMSLSTSVRTTSPGIVRQMPVGPGVFTVSPARTVPPRRPFEPGNNVVKPPMTPSSNKVVTVKRFDSSSTQTNFTQFVNESGTNVMTPIVPVTSQSANALHFTSNSQSNPKTNMTPTPQKVSSVSSNSPSPAVPISGKSPSSFPVSNPSEVPVKSTFDVVKSTSDAVRTSSPLADSNLKLQSTTPNQEVLKEKIYPSLAVTVKPCLTKLHPTTYSKERLRLDNDLRMIIKMTPQVFTEYLLQRRLLKSHQLCRNHLQQFKLGVYSDASRFPYSGGYVWISECCVGSFCSIFSGSIFHKTMQPPANIVKYMYHWSCNTSIKNVIQWMKVDSSVIKTYYTMFRGVCTIAVQDKVGLLGGPNKKVQVGVVTLGTSQGQEGERHPKMDILGAFDKETTRLRLKALEYGTYNNTKLRRILSILKRWVHPESIVITDFPVDVKLSMEYGFHNMVLSSDKKKDNNNHDILDYLKTWVPKMFQKTLHLLSICIIQQFLDELVWREIWGPTPLQAYNNFISHLAEITAQRGPDILFTLKRVAANPSKNWKSSSRQHLESQDNVSIASGKAVEHLSTQNPTKLNEMPPQLSSAAIENAPAAKGPHKDSPSVLRSVLMYEKTTNNDDSTVPQNKKLPVADPSTSETYNPSNEKSRATSDSVSLEPYFYGRIAGIPKREKYSGAFLAECTFCKRDFLTSSTFTQHLIHHALNSDEDLAKESTEQMRTVCRHCLQVVLDITTHTENRHEKSTSSIDTACKICNVDYRTNDELFWHMSNVHCELDMPYNCEQCGFRTSIYDEVVAHFVNCHDKDSCLQCPFCLKVVRLCSNDGIEITSNQNYFVQHIQKHYTLVSRCEKCLLSFTNMGLLQLHQEKFHISGKHLPNIVRYYDKNVNNFKMMNRPGVDPLPLITSQESSFHMLKGNEKSLVKFDPSLSNFNCAECDSPILQNHFHVKMMVCTKCPFQSYCANAINEHSARFHPAMDVLSSKIRQIIGGCPVAETPLFCSRCSFTSKNGNKMAIHLAKCCESAVATTATKRKIDKPNSSRKMRKII